MCGELTGNYDLYRLFFGKDPLTGGVASRLEAGLWTALLLLPTSKIVEGIKPNTIR
ncbi:pre-toxin TG domain-containing protein [Enterococcus faecalis]